jgi:ATP-binding cassette subfamily B protein
LSFGEKQRVSIARALLKGPEIVILDEPTSGLDSRTELIVQDSIARLCQGRTVIVVAHRLATIQNADKVIVLEDGKVAEQGKLSELIEKKGYFSQYWQAQQLQ